MNGGFCFPLRWKTESRFLAEGSSYWRDKETEDKEGSYDCRSRKEAGRMKCRTEENGLSDWRRTIPLKRGEFKGRTHMLFMGIG